MNCLTYALSKWLDEGGYILVRKSRLRLLFPRPWWHPVHLVPHFLHRDWNKVVTQYVPTADQDARHLKAGLWLAWLELWSFDGEVIGDDQPISKEQ